MERELRTATEEPQDHSDLCEECGNAIKGTPWQLGSWECLCADCVVRIIPGYFRRPL